MKRFFAIMILGFFLMTVNVCHAFETVDGILIKNVKVNNTKNQAVQIFADNSDKELCVGGPVNEAWAYLDKTDENFEVKYAGILTAFALNKAVILSTESVTGSDGKVTCKIQNIDLIGQ